MQVIVRPTYEVTLERVVALDRAEGRTALEMGQALLERYPIGEETRRNGGVEAEMRRLAEESGISLATLSERRLVAHRMSKVAAATFDASGVRLAAMSADIAGLPDVSYSVVREALLGGDAADRARVWDLIQRPNPDHPTGRWTVDAVRVAQGRKPTRYPPDERLDAFVGTASPQEKAEAVKALMSDPAVVAEVTERARQEIRENLAANPPAPKHPMAAAFEENMAANQRVLDVRDLLNDLAATVEGFERRIATAIAQGAPAAGGNYRAPRQRLQEIKSRVARIEADVVGWLTTGKSDVDRFIDSALKGE